MFARLTAAALLASIPAIALAQAPAKADEAKPVTRIELSNRLDSDYADLDADKDGTISKDEFRTPTISNFERLDKNKDGTLSVAEQDSAATAAVSKTPVKKAVVKETPPIGR